MTKITFVRHGNTNWNIEKRAQGHLNNPLNQTGFRQAEAIARRLKEYKWDVFYSSDLLRARQTAEVISTYLDIPIIFDQRLRETDRGIIAGTIEEERIQLWGEDWRNLNIWQESSHSQRVRGRHFIEEMHERYPGKNILAVSHGKLLIETLKEMLPCESENKEPLENTSVTIIKKSTEDWQYALYNCIRHLDN